MPALTLQSPPRFGARLVSHQPVALRYTRDDLDTYVAAQIWRLDTDDYSSVTQVLSNWASIESRINAQDFRRFDFYNDLRQGNTYAITAAGKTLGMLEVGIADGKLQLNSAMTAPWNHPHIRKGDPSSRDYGRFHQVVAAMLYGALQETRYAPCDGTPSTNTSDAIIAVFPKNSSVKNPAGIPSPVYLPCPKRIASA